MSKPNHHVIIADLVQRIPAMAQDGPQNNEKLLTELLKPITEQEPTPPEGISFLIQLKDAYFAAVGPCLHHSQTCNIHTGESPGTGCNCPFGKLSALAFDAENWLRQNHHDTHHVSRS